MRIILFVIDFYIKILFFVFTLISIRSSLLYWLHLVLGFYFESKAKMASQQSTTVDGAVWSVYQVSLWLESVSCFSTNLKKIFKRTNLANAVWCICGNILYNLIHSDSFAEIQALKPKVLNFCLKKKRKWNWNILSHLILTCLSTFIPLRYLHVKNAVDIFFNTPWKHSDHCSSLILVRKLKFHWAVLISS